jgi:hypothetical protein
MRDDTTNDIRPTCKTCQFWFPITKETEETKAFGKCKRNPPTMLVQEGQTYSGHPIVPDTEFCGEYLERWS